MQIIFNKNNLDKEILEKITDAYNFTIELLNVPCKDLEVSVSFVTPQKIQKLNKDFREKDSVTDVLSFPTLLNVGQVNMQLIINKLTKENFSHDIDLETGNINLGDICVCMQKAKSQAKEYGNTISREVVYLCVHGLLHLLGYDHLKEDEKEIMRDVEEKIMSHINLER